MDLNTVSQGLGAAFVAVVRDSDGNPYTGYTGAEALAGTVSAGQDQPALFAPTLTWLDASAGKISVAIAGADTAALDPGRYVLRIALADGSAELYEGDLDVGYSPGTAAALPSYGSYQDLEDRAPWISKLQRPDDLAGFAKQRYLARKWFEDLLHRHNRLGGGMLQDFQFVPGISFGGLYGPGLIWRDGRRSKELQDWLDAGRLDVTAQVIDAVSCYAIALLCDRQLDPTKDDTGYGAAARKFFGRADTAAMGITAELDTDGDGTNDTVIRLGVFDTLEG